MILTYSYSYGLTLRRSQGRRRWGPFDFVAHLLLGGHAAWRHRSPHERGRSGMLLRDQSLRSATIKTLFYFERSNGCSGYHLALQIVSCYYLSTLIPFARPGAGFLGRPLRFCSCPMSMSSSASVRSGPEAVPDSAGRRRHRCRRGRSGSGTGHDGSLFLFLSHSSGPWS